MLPRKRKLILCVLLLMIYATMYLLHQITGQSDFLVVLRNRIAAEDKWNYQDDSDEDDVIYDLIDSGDEPDVQKRLVFPYRYILDEPDFCNPDLKVLNIIPVRASDRQVRDGVRRTWGFEDIVSSTKLKSLFLVAKSQSPEEQQNLEEESRQFHDIIQVDFVDAYLNLTLKTLTALHWKQSRCSQVPWLLKSDGDVFMNPWAVVKVLSEAKKDFVCRVLRQRFVCRAVSKKCRDKHWVISREHYPHDRYPPYCNGPAYALNQKAVSSIINRVATRETHFPMEDAYFTGVLAQGLDLHYYDLGKRMRLYHLRSPPYESVNSGWALFVVDSFRSSNGKYTHDDLWQHLIDSRTKS